MAITVTPLKLLQKDHVKEFEEYGIRSIAINHDTPHDKTLWSRVSKGSFHNLLVAPEQFFPEGGHIPRLALQLKDQSFVNRIGFFFIDEVHFISTAGEAQPGEKFINLATLLKNDIILVEPSLSPTSDPLFVLSPAITTFLSAGCSISPAEVSGAWSLLKDVIWSGGITISVGLLWETHGTRRGVAEYLLYPPSHSCLHPNCQCRTKGMTLKKAAQTYVVLFMLTKGPCIVKSVHLYCQTCEIDYHHNYSVFKGKRTYYEHQPDKIQAVDHVFIEKSAVELFWTAMDFSWTSATNCAKLYNLCLSHGKQTPADYKVKFELSVEHVWDGYVITSLLEDCEHRMSTLFAPHTGEQWDRFTEAMIARNRHIQLYGYEQNLSCPSITNSGEIPAAHMSRSLTMHLDNIKMQYQHELIPLTQQREALIRVVAELKAAREMQFLEEITVLNAQNEELARLSAQYVRQIETSHSATPTMDVIGLKDESAAYLLCEKSTLFDR
ncbi:hypothetical protein EV702DRAFT_1239534 [Suillus placidus]|uniref:CxC5 like cysteine cluster associated with KDZ domain-containing protein n=1 Tax=Suillus placidus TaxID=48579 RepID=A0A9P7D7N3_9AGAM|nr:hypothetical protein EV702DRAFT_1239534 [Suillus placidus]